MMLERMRIEKNEMNKEKKEKMDIKNREVYFRNGNC